MRALLELDRHARTHHGVITLDVARRLGWTDTDWCRALDRGHLERLHPGVARLPGSPSTPVQRIHAAVCAAGSSARASHRSAATLWIVERPDDDPVDLIVARSVTRLHLEGVVVHRPRDRDDLTPTMRSMTPCTNLLRTLVDLGAVTGSVEDAVGAAITSGAVTPSVLHHLLLRHGRPGRNGVGPLRAAVEHWTHQGKPADSVLELGMARLIERYGLPPVEFHARCGGFEVDFRVVGTPVVLECVGWDYHGRTRPQFERDQERILLLGAAGYVVLPFTWRQVTRRPGWTAARIRELVDRWS
jgi:hypothetical protein